jgi:hypothetical protein
VRNPAVREGYNYITADNYCFNDLHRVRHALKVQSARAVCRSRSPH